MKISPKETHAVIKLFFLQNALTLFVLGFCETFKFVVAACFFALSDALYWMFAVFALVSLYSGFVVTSVREKAESVTLAKTPLISGENRLYLVSLHPVKY